MTSRFTSSNAPQPGASDSLSTQTVGLVHLSEFRKRRDDLREAQESRAREALLSASNPAASAAAASPDAGAAAAAKKPAKKKRKAGKVKLSFSDDEGDADADDDSGGGGPAVVKKAKTKNTDDAKDPSLDTPPSTSAPAPAPTKSKFAANGALLAPRIVTKTSQKQEAAERDRLRREFLVLQDAIKNTEIAMPFVFYDGTNIPGGVVRVRKGDYAWVFLDKSRKVGAALGVGDKTHSRKDWARVSIDDLILVRGTVIIPHHYDFYYFIMNKTTGPGGARLFDFSAEAPPQKPVVLDSDTDSVQSGDEGVAAAAKTAAPTSAPPAALSTAASRAAAKAKARSLLPDISTLEGAGDDPIFTKVVDRRWYERNKHIYPASTWQEFDAEKDYAADVKRDLNGNAFFYS